MAKFILKRFGASVLTLFAILTASFFMMKMAPGGPFDQEKMPPPEIYQAIQAKYHLDKPLFQQYLIYLGNLAKGDLGPSFKTAHLAVNAVLAEGLTYTLKIGLGALIFTFKC